MLSVLPVVKVPLTVICSKSVPATRAQAASGSAVGFQPRKGGNENSGDRA